MIGRLVSTSLVLALMATSVSAQTAKSETAGKAAVAVEVTEPRDVVAALYKLAVAALKKPRPQSPFFEPEARRKYFSKSFDLLVTTSETKAAHDGDRMIDFDPISASQDADPKTVTLKTNMMELGKAVVSASFTTFGKPIVVTYDFVKEDGDWKIDDIKGTTEKEAWSVRKILKGTGREPTALPAKSDGKASAKPVEK